MYILEIIGIIILGLIAVIYKNQKSQNAKLEEKINQIETTLFKDYLSKDDINLLLDRIITQLDRIENKLDNKKDK